MVILHATSKAAASQRTQCGALTTDLLVAISILLTALIPISFSILSHQKFLRSTYYRAIAMELVDGEMEVLAAGEWQSFHEGSQPYAVRGDAARNLPPGRFNLTIKGDSLNLEWLPANGKQAASVGRTASIASKPPGKK